MKPCDLLITGANMYLIKSAFRKWWAINCNGYIDYFTAMAWGQRGWIVNVTSGRTERSFRVFESDDAVTDFLTFEEA
jgi:hypothetical protein